MCTWSQSPPACTVLSPHLQTQTDASHRGHYRHVTPAGYTENTHDSLNTMHRRRPTDSNNTKYSEEQRQRTRSRSHTHAHTASSRRTHTHTLTILAFSQIHSFSTAMRRGVLCFSTGGWASGARATDPSSCPPVQQTTLQQRFAVQGGPLLTKTPECCRL